MELGGKMARRAFARIAFAASVFGAPTVVAQAQTAPGERQPEAPASSQGGVTLPPVQIIQPQPKRPKPPKKTLTAPPPAERRTPAVYSGQPEAGEQAVAMTPVKGSEIPLDKVPGAVSQVSAANSRRRLARTPGRAAAICSRRNHLRRQRQCGLRQRSVSRLYRVARRGHAAGACRLSEWRAYQRGLRRHGELGSHSANAIGNVSRLAATRFSG